MSHESDATTGEISCVENGMSEVPSAGSMSVIAEIDRAIEDAVGRIMSGQSGRGGGDFGLVSDLAARRVELTEPPGFARIEQLLGKKLSA